MSGVGHRRLGLLAPFAELPGEFADVLTEAPEEVRTWQVVTPAPDSHEPADLRSFSRDEVLADGARRLLRWRPELVVWACTSGSFVFGRRGALAQREALARAAGVPATSTSLAFVAALEALDARRVVLLSPYPDAATKAFADFLGEWHLQVAAHRALDHPGARSSESLRCPDVVQALATLPPDLPVLVPDTAVWGFELLAGLRHLERTVLVANQVTLWQALVLMGVGTELPSLGALRGCRP